jgi:hypothetical protein
MTSTGEAVTYITDVTADGRRALGLAIIDLAGLHNPDLSFWSTGVFRSYEQTGITSMPHIFKTTTLLEIF